VIRVEGLEVRAGDFTLAIDELAVTPGEYLIVLGPTASGKTVLLEAVAGLRRSTAGRVWFDRRDVTADPPEKRGVGLVYQNYALFPHLTVEANIGFGLKRGRRQTVQELASLAGIDHLLNRYPEGLSGGEQQRVALARALAVEPELLLLDEPLSALDGPTRQELQRELKRLHRQLGTTVVHVTHDLDEAMALGDKVAVLIGGRLSQVGAPDEVTRVPADTHVATLVGIDNIFPVAAIACCPEDETRMVRLRTGHTFITSSAQAHNTSTSAVDLWMVVRGEEIEIEPAVSENTGGALQGVVKAVQLQSVHARIEVELLPAGDALPPVLTVNTLRPQLSRMQLTVGSRVMLSVAPPAVHLCGDRPAARVRELAPAEAG
jgi:ABC-type Fe3+/spermidine/putrescine transport system ATPase subunit